MFETTVSSSNWPELVAEAKQGDGDALDQLLAEARNFMRMTAITGLGKTVQSKFDASDIVQLSAIDVQRSIHDFKGSSEAELRRWLIQIVNHNLCDQARRYTHTRRREVDREVVIEQRAVNQLRGNDQSPSEQMRRGETDRELQLAIQRLPRLQRSVIEARHRDGLDYNQIAQRLGITEVAARKLWSRAAKQLKSWLAEIE